MADEQNPGGQHRFSRAEYGRLAPFQQGFVTYMQGAWNPDVPNASPYRRDSKQHREFCQGEQRGVIVAQDSDMKLAHEMLDLLKRLGLEGQPLRDESNEKPE